MTAVLGQHVEQYVLISTVSAYLDWPAVSVSEDSALWPSSPTYTEDSPELAGLTIGGQYGTLKAGCEAAAMEGGMRSLIVRPGVILGPGEYVGRGLKLLARASRGGRWLLPAPPEQPIQPVDVRDVSTFLLDSVEAKQDGVFNLVAPIGHSTYGSMIDVCLALTGHRAHPVWVDPRWLDEQAVRQWTEIPLWRVPRGTWQVDGRRAAEEGFVCRPLRDTLHDFKEALTATGSSTTHGKASLGCVPSGRPNSSTLGMTLSRQALGSTCRETRLGVEDLDLIAQVAGLCGFVPIATGEPTR
ncbi:hypothetical protein AB0L64_10320 [Kribbella sp. NPDC051936]|uniref:hypothetical protein n=1 Tax=Kribbella sp. NPDC051936 TaxID=3154946 RepID=UPI003432135C